MGKSDRTRRALLELAIPAFVDLPFERLSLQGVADACGVSLWAFRYHFNNVERLFRAVANHLIDEVATRSAYAPEPGQPVIEAIGAYASFVASLLESEAYRSLLYFVLRNGRHHPWLEKAYEQRIVAKVCGDLETVIAKSGENHGVVVALTAGTARRFYKRLETELVLQSLLPACAEASPPDRDDVVRAASREAFAATYVFDWKVPTAA
jgi:AcrR family transcriptional regulator